VPDLTAILRDGWMGTDRIPVEVITERARKLADEVETQELADLVRLAFGGKPSKAAQRLVASFNTDDLVVSTPEQGLRHQLLGVSILLNVFEELSGPAVDQTALMVKSLKFLGRLETAEPLIVAANRHLQWSRNATASAPPRPRAVSQTPATKQALEALATADWNIYRTAIVELSNELGRVRQALSRQAIWVEEREAPSKSQLELLWWVTSGTSFVTDRTFESLTPGAAAIVAGIDVSHLAPVAPGPPASIGLLRYAIATSGGRPEDPADLGALQGEMHSVGGGEGPEPADSEHDLFPLFGYLAGLSQKPARSEIRLIDVAEQALNECYLHSLRDIPEE
jgi:hypothetical protein